jgi:beta-galactosidase
MKKKTPAPTSPAVPQYIGVDYYPEHWTRERWPIDARLMKEAGFTVARLAEFAWTFMEPEEGRFDFTWLDEAIAHLTQNGISVILGTPTATMPAWMCRKYPDVMRVLESGNREIWGVRKNNCPSNGTFRLFSERITRAMAAHYTANPAVIGWQTDNEFGGQPCHCGTCKIQFQEWLRTKYGTLDTLNRTWGTHFWSHTFREWAEIMIPLDHHNPGMWLDYKRFVTWQEVRFQHEQIAILRAGCPAQFITHNCMGLYQNINYYQLAEELDFVSWDNYPVWGSPTIPYDAAMAADLMRGLKRKNFWIMEQTAGPGGWNTMGRNVRPGELRKVTYQQLAHGADSIVWFRWRTCTAGREQYWHGLLGHDGVPLRRYQEARTTAREFHKIKAQLAGTTVRPPVGILYDYDSLWAIQSQPGFTGNQYVAHVRRYYQALMRAGVNADLIQPGSDLKAYRLVIMPQQFILPDALADQVIAYVAQGGVLMTDFRTGVKDLGGLCHERTLPGKLTDLLGIVIEEYEALDDLMTYAADGVEGFPKALTAIKFADWITAGDAEVLVKYLPWHMHDFAALTRKKHRKGCAYYLGTTFKEDSFYDALIGALLKSARITPLLAPPPGVEVSLREGKTGRFLFVMNHIEEVQRVEIPFAARDLLTRKEVVERIELEPYGVAVLKLT